MMTQASRTSLLAVAVAGILATATMSTTASAAVSVTASTNDAVAGAKEDALEEITVQAQRSTPEMARAAQRQAPNLINLTTAEEMQQLPDVNTGEAVRRIPGISLETDTGEGRYINIRGLDADFNSTTFGGLRLPPTNNSSPSGAGRAVAFDSIPLGFVGAIKVTKSNIPEQDAEALGGTIDITPKTAPPDGKPFADLKLGTGEELQRHTWITDLAGTAGTRFGGSGGYQPLSILVTASLYNDRRGIDDAEAGFIDASTTNPGKQFAGFEQRFYNYHRERHGYGADFGWAPTEDDKYFLRIYDAGYSETVTRNLLSWDLTGSPSIDPNNANGFLDTSGFSKKIRDEKEYLDSKVAEIGGKNQIQGMELDYHVGYTKGTYNKPYDYNSTFTNSALANVVYDNTTQPNWPAIHTLPGTAANGTVNVNPTDPTGYVLSGLRTQSQHVDDHEWGIGANLAIPVHFTDRSDEEMKFGVNARLRNKSGDQTSVNVDGAALPALDLAAATSGGPINFYQNHYGNGPNIDAAALRAIYAASSGSLVYDPVGDALAATHDKEDVYAAYGQYQFGFGALGIITGLRIENTKATYGGYKADTSGSPASANCPILDPGSPATPTDPAVPPTHVCAVSASKSYTNFFPTAQARYEFLPDLIGRAALSSTIARPGFPQVTAASVVDNSGNIVTGNPNLKPTKAYGLDLAIEKYLPHAGVASLGFFAKDIKDVIVKNVQQTAGGPQNTGGNLGLVQVISFGNAPTAHLFGIETNYVQHLSDFVAGPLGGFGVSANWTWVQSKYDVPVTDANTGLTIGTRSSMLQSTSRNTANAELLYDLNDLHVTLGAYYTSKNIFGVGSTNATDIYTQERLSVDFGSQFKVSEPFSLYLNVKNLTNTALKFTEGPGTDRVIQREFYGATVQFGGNYKF